MVRSGADFEAIFLIESYPSNGMKVPSPFVKCYTSNINIDAHGIVSRALLL